MAQFGHCGWVSGGGSSSVFGITRIRVLKATLTEPGLISGFTAPLSTYKFPPSGAESYYKAVIYSDDGSGPAALQGVSEIEYQAGQQSVILITFTFSPAIELPAGDYWLGVLASGINSTTRTDGTGADRLSNYVGGADYYSNPPATFPAYGAEGTGNYWYCAQYTLAANPYPFTQLKKGFITAYHCFISGYVRAKVTGFDPLKLPDGTLF